MLDGNYTKSRTTYKFRSTDGASHESASIFAGPLDARYTPTVARASVRVMANNPDDLGDSYCWQIEAVFDLAKPKEKWAARNDFTQIGSSNVELISGPATPVCTAMYKQGVGNNNIYVYYKGAAGKTYDWTWDIEMTYLRSFKADTGYPPRLTLQISSGMGPAEDWCGLTEGIHTLGATVYKQQSYSAAYDPDKIKKEYWDFLDSENTTSYLYLHARATYEDTTNYDYKSLFQFYWATRSASTSTSVTASSGGTPPTGINGWLRDVMLDRTIVIGSGPTAVTFNWDRQATDPAGFWGNY